jgi:DNA-binding LacI/PurR family transcriptional regulator
VICVSADQAALAVQILGEMGLEVPRDLSLVAYGPLSRVAQYPTPSLCLLEADLVHFGRKTYELYREAKEGGKPRTLSIDWNWVGAGTSIGPPKK